MEMKLIRSVFNPKSTMGKMFIDGQFFAFTCEDTDRHINGDVTRKVQNETAIDPGRYEVVLSFSNHFQKFLPELKNVPCFAGIRIHGGNTAADSEGCILIGTESDMVSRISNCKPKVDALVAMLKKVTQKEKIFMEIVRQQ